MSRFDYNCPKCRITLAGDTDQMGTNVLCPGCGLVFMVPQKPFASATARSFKVELPTQEAMQVVKRISRNQALIRFVMIVVGGAIALAGLAGFIRYASNYSKSVDRTPFEAGSASQSGAGNNVAPGGRAGAASQALTQAEQNVLALFQAAVTARNQALAAEQNRHNLHATYKGKNLPTAQYKAVMVRYAAADAEVTRAQQAAQAAALSFDAAFAEYQRLGGKVDYSARLPR